MNVLVALPGPRILKKLMKIQAALNIVLCREEWLRYHSYDPDWNNNIAMAKIDNGSGDHIVILFTPMGTIIKGFDHESEVSPHARDEFEIWPGIYEAVPNTLLVLLEDEAIERENVTFCIWQEASDLNWQKGEIEFSEGEDDGSDFLLGTILQTPADFVEFAESYFEIELSLAILTKIYDGHPITTEMIQALNPDSDTEKVLRELESLGSLN